MTAAGRFPSALRRLRAPRARAWVALAAAVLLSHAWLLQGLPRAAGAGWQAPAPRPLQVRQITPTLPSPTVAAGRPGLEPAPASTPAAMRPLANTVTATARPRPTMGPTMGPTTNPTMAAPVDLPAQTAAAAPDLEAGGLPIPVYPTQLPPPATLQYELRRGRSQGTAELDWRPAAGQYQLSLRGQTTPPGMLDWVSQGGLDEAGIAPLRYVEHRRGREARAANFQRDSGRITFSGPAVEYPLTAGAQDRLSWMVQLAGVLAADPARAETGAEVLIWVVGTRGDGEVWTFTVQGLESLDLPIGRVDGTVHLVREPRRPYDPQVQVWLDPQRHHLPVQVQWRVRADGDGQTLQLKGLK